MNPGSRIAEFATTKPRLITLIMTALTLGLFFLALLPSVFPARFSSLHGLTVDTDPENMLPHDEPVRVYHDDMKKEMSLYDMVVVGVVHEHHPDGVFNPETLGNVYELTEFAKELQWEDGGVIASDIIAPSVVDNIEQGKEPGYVNFEWLMKEPPATRDEALLVRDRAQKMPFLNGTLVSDDGKALAIYLPLSSKDMSSRVYTALNKKLAEMNPAEDYHITGLPVAEDVFGLQMFKQMAVSAPSAMVVIFLLMLFFFKRLAFIISPMIVAVVSVIMTMGMLIASGQTVHIMSSMIPIFIMPIAVLDAIHILSDFFDEYPRIRDRKKTIVHVMKTLFMPMLYTSVTTVVGFGSLALVPIPPVQTFGIFVSIGVFLAYLWTITFIPAYIMMMSPKALENFGNKSTGDKETGGLMDRFLMLVGRGTYHRAKLIVAAVAVLSVFALLGIKQIRINDNPTNWFKKSHPIRVADRVLNSHFGGTYMSYLTLEAGAGDGLSDEYIEGLKQRLAVAGLSGELNEVIDRAASSMKSQSGLIAELEAFADEKLFEVEGDAYGAWDQVLTRLSSERGRTEPFKQPEVLHLMERLEEHLLKTDIVGKVNSLADIVKTVRRELLSGAEEDYAIPESSGAVAQTLLQYQNSHRPQDLWHLVTPDFSKSVMWLQLRSGDNTDMEKVIESVEEFFSSEELSGGIPVNHNWFGLTYINVEWQKKMVAGMLEAFLGSFLIVFLMMTLLYRSALWGALSMIPLSVSIAFIYGVIGWVGKDYDMPVAVLSALSLGLAVDYAIHFLSRSRSLYQTHGSWEAATPAAFGEPARAIVRNAIVVGIGFLPLLAAPLIPYRTVGFFIAAILLAAGVASIVILPALIRLLESVLFPKTKYCCIVCDTGTIAVASLAVALILGLNLRHMMEFSYIQIGLAGVVTAVLMGLGSLVMSRKKCGVKHGENDDE